MKGFLSFVLIGFCSALFGNDLSLKVKLNEHESYQLYEHLNLVAEVEANGKSLVKKTDEIYCSRTSYYPGDFEYSCQVNLRISESGMLTR